MTQSARDGRPSGAPPDRTPGAAPETTPDGAPETTPEGAPGAAHGGGPSGTPPVPGAPDAAELAHQAGIPPEHRPLAEKLARLDGRLAAMDGRVGEVLGRLEESGAARRTPAWRRVTQGEHRWPAALAIAVMIGLQLSVPSRFTLLGSWVLPAFEAVLLVVIVAANPTRITTASRGLRRLGLTLIALASFANGWAAAYLVIGLVRGTEGRSAEGLLVVGGSIWLTNVIIFGLWYWELDRGGPGARAQAMQPMPDFVFPQMTSPDLAPPEWEPGFGDYLYLAFTNATAFSPTDTMPFSRWSKLAMSVQAGVSLTVGALIIARAVNILT